MSILCCFGSVLAYVLYVLCLLRLLYLFTFGYMLYLLVFVGMRCMCWCF